MRHNHNGAGNRHRSPYSPVRFDSPCVGIVLGLFVVALTMLVICTGGSL